MEDRKQNPATSDPKAAFAKEEANFDRGIYDIKDEVDYSASAGDMGLSEEIVRDISAHKNEASWLLERRLEGLHLFEQAHNPLWGTDISPVQMEKIVTYIKPQAKATADWKELPDYILNTFDRLGIPEAEYKQELSGVGAQYDSEIVYHRLTKEMEDKGVIYCDFDVGAAQYPELVKKYFGKCIPPTAHRYAALHYALWSGGSLVYVPKGVQVDVPLQSYYRLNAPGAGQFEHTLIILEEGSYCHFIEGCSAPKYNALNLHAGAVELFVGEGATLRYSTIENWSKNMYNLNTKRAIVEKNGTIEWVSGSFGSRVSNLYPMSILKGEYARSDYTGISFAGHDQVIDTGMKVIHAAPHTSSNINSKSICKGGGVANYRSEVRVLPKAIGSKSSADCQSLMLDNLSRSDTIPVIDVQTDQVDLGHEAKIGRISDAQIFYLTSRGIDEKEARAMIVRGFAEPVAKELPLEYASEMNNLISLELEGGLA